MPSFIRERNVQARRFKSIDGPPTIQFKALQIGRWITSGSFCDYHEATIRSDRRKSTLTVKMLRVDNWSEGTNTTEHRDLLQEAQLLSSLTRHQHIIALGAISMVNGNVCLVMSKLETTLTKHLKLWKQEKRNQRQNIGSFGNRDWTSRVESVALGVADGLQFLHENGVVHRGINPDNIGFDGMGNVVLFDFTKAREIPDDDEQSEPTETELKSSEAPELSSSSVPKPRASSFNQSSSFVSVGTLTSNGSSCLQSMQERYTAPEILAHPNDESQHKAASDVYSFGILLWELVTLGTPYRKVRRSDDLLKAAIDGQRPLIRALPSNKYLRKLVNSCWHHEQSRRPAAGAVHAMLKLIISGSPTKPSPSENKIPSPPLTRRHSSVLSPKLPGLQSPSL